MPAKKNGTGEGDDQWSLAAQSKNRTNCLVEVKLQSFLSVLRDVKLNLYTLTFYGLFHARKKDNLFENSNHFKLYILNNHK